MRSNLIILLLLVLGLWPLPTLAKLLNICGCRNYLMYFIALHFAYKFSNQPPLMWLFQTVTQLSLSLSLREHATHFWISNNQILRRVPFNLPNTWQTNIDASLGTTCRYSALLQSLRFFFLFWHRSCVTSHLIWRCVKKGNVYSPKRAETTGVRQMHKYKKLFPSHTFTHTRRAGKFVLH